MKRSLVLAAVLALPLAAAAPASAQFGGRSAMMQAVEPDVWSRDLPIFAESLQLEEWQRPIVEMLVEDYLATFNAGIDAMKQQMQGISAKGEKPSVQDVLQPLEDWAGKKKELYANFLQGVRSQLSEQQLERWPVLERALRRERLLPQANLSGEGINLIGVMQDLAPPTEITVAASNALETYELQLDEALLARQSRMEEIVPALKDAMAEMNHERGLELQERIMASRLALREVQDRNTEAIAATMGAEWGERFRAMALQRAYTEAFQPSPVMRQFVAALALPDLAEEKKTAITSLREEFQRALDDLSTQMLAAIRKQEPLDARKKVLNARERREGRAVPVPAAPEQGSVESIRAARAQTNEKYRKALEDLLTLEVYEQLPGGGKMSIKARETKPGAANEGRNRVSTSRPGGRGTAGRGTTIPTDGERPDPASVPPAGAPAPPASID